MHVHIFGSWRDCVQNAQITFNTNNFLQNLNITKINLERCFSESCKTTASIDLPSMFTTEGCDHSLVCKRPFSFLQSYVLATSGGFREDK